MLLITANCHAFLKLFLFRQCIIHIISVMLYVTESLSLKYTLQLQPGLFVTY